MTVFSILTLMFFHSNKKFSVKILFGKITIRVNLFKAKNKRFINFLLLNPQLCYRFILLTDQFFLEQYFSCETTSVS